jgi:GNAT superfamily N-acetyltransferase
MRIVETALLGEAQKGAVMQLWNEEYPAQLGYALAEDFDRYLDGLSGKTHYLGVDIKGQIIAWALSFIRDGERWFAIIVHRSAQGKGNGAAMLQELKAKGERLAGWVSDHERYVKSDGSPYPSPLAFYLRNGFIVRPHVRLEIEKLSAVRIDWQP